MIGRGRERGDLACFLNNIFKVIKRYKLRVPVMSQKKLYRAYVACFKELKFVISLYLPMPRDARGAILTGVSPLCLDYYNRGMVSRYCCCFTKVSGEASKIQRQKLRHHYAIP